MSKVFTISDGLENLGALKTGGQGSVYKGKRIGAIYSAVKLIPTPIFTEDKSDKNYLNFINEVTKLQKVNENPSPNVVKILNWGITESGSFPFIEMEFIDGPELCELIEAPQPKAFRVKELIKVADQLANAIAHCHQVGVKHGDIKSNNVKYNILTGNYILLDFGLAILTEEQRRTSIRHAGAVEFMAPEQHEGKMLLQSDIYSYGIILYELLAGQVPFPLTDNGDTSRNMVMVNHLEEEIPDAIALRKKNLAVTMSETEVLKEMQVPSWLLRVIKKCLRKDPTERYADGTELLEAIASGMLLATQHDQNAPKPIVSGNLKPITVDIPEAGHKSFKARINDFFNQANITIAKNHFVGGLAVFLVIVTLLSYSAITNKERVVYYSDSQQNKQFVPPFIVYGNDYMSKLKKAEEEKRLEVQRIEAQRKEAERKANSEKANAAKKKKRKKFLGIF